VHTLISALVGSVGDNDSVKTLTFDGIFLGDAGAAALATMVRIV
jgi:hypothetical protein